MPRFLIAAAHKSSGKTVVSTGLARALADRGIAVQPFKKGPDYIDPMWLGLAARRACYNLDFNTMPPDEVAAFFAARQGELDLIEANKGLFDGVAEDGSDSNAAMAKLLKTPVVLVVDTGGTTRGIAPLLMGYRAFDPAVDLRGVILNKTGGTRHEVKLRAAVATYTDLPVLGAIGRNDALDIGERHLGLTTPVESDAVATRIAGFAQAVSSGVDLDRIINIAALAPKLPRPAAASASTPHPRVTIAIPRDRAFGFYYPDDLEAFASAGADLVFFDALTDTALPKADGLFIGGGFPETQAAALAANNRLRADIKARIENGLPTYAECGGLMYLSKTLHWHGESHPMVGVIPGDAVMHARPKGRGYARYETTEPHLWEEPGHSVRAHEFHYASIENLPEDSVFARRITRGAGVTGTDDGIVRYNMIAGFCHLRSTAQNPWVMRFVDFVRAKRVK